MSWIQKMNVGTGKHQEVMVWANIERYWMLRGPEDVTSIFQRLLHLSTPCSQESACSGGDPGSISGSERSPGEASGYPLQYSSLENSMDRETSGLQSMGPQRVRHD